MELEKAQYSDCHICIQTEFQAPGQFCIRQ
jgi:hypothetical protein